jgi:DNA uptake protein ComE-like DNA-binding protein
VSLPVLTAEQRAEALEKAAAARRARAEVKSRLKDSRVNVADVIKQGQTDEVVGKMKVSALLEALPGIGKVRAQQIMEEVGISPTRRVRGLGSQQLTALVERFTP